MIEEVGSQSGPPALSSPQGARVVAFLVHGVGLPPEDLDEEQLIQRLFGKDLPQELHDLGIENEVELVPIEWHRDVARPTTFLGFIKFGQVAGLMRGFIGASASFRDPIPVTQSLLSVVTMLMPLAVLTAFCGLLARAAAPRPWPGVSAALPWLLAVSRFHLRGMLALLFPDSVFPVAGAAVLAYAGLLGAAGLAHLLNTTWRTSAFDALRSVLLVLLIRPLTFTGVALLSTPVIVLWVVYGLTTIRQAIWPVSKQLAVAMDPARGPVPDAALSLNGEMEHNALFFYALIGLTLVAVAVFGRRLAWPMKVAADVLCFMGDASYSSRLIDKVESKFRAGRVDGAHVLLVGHSLGSVVLFRWLLSRADWPEHPASVTFVTMGSPITRWLGRFFSVALPGADRGARALKSKLPSFAWLNIYRPLDPVGGSLFTSEPPWLLSRSTGQLNALHGGYFSDPLVIAHIRDFTRASARAGGIERKDESREPTDFPARAAEKEIRFNRSVGILVAAGLAVAVGLLAGIRAGIAAKDQADRESMRSVARIQQEIALDPIDLGGWVYAHEQAYVFDSPDEKCRPPAVMIYTRYVPPQSPGTPGREQAVCQMMITCLILLFHPQGQVSAVAFDLEKSSDVAGLDVLMREPGQNAFVKESWGFKAARRYPVRVRYLRGDPTVFTLPDYRRNLTEKETAIKVLALLEGAGAIIFPLAAFVLVFLLVFFSVGYLLLIYAGRDPKEILGDDPPSAKAP